METLQSSEEATFNPKEFREIIKEIVTKVLGDQMYDQEKVPEWIDTINSTVIKRLCSLQIPFKFISTTVIMEKKLAFLHCSCSALWDNVNDNNCVYEYDTNKHLYALTTVFGMQI